LFYAIIFTGISFLADQSNLLGISNLISDQSEKIYQRLTAGFYGDKNRRGKPRLAVMLYTDNAARLPGMSWPMKYDALAEQISDVNLAGARGIFIDMVFRSSGRDEGAFCRLIQAMTEASGSSLPSDFDGPNCLEIVPRYQQILANPEWHSDDKWPLQLESDTTGEDAFPDSPKLLLVGASLEYLNAREELRKCRVTSSCPEAAETFIETVNAWPATFVIDHVAQLVPLSVGAVDGKAVHLSVDEARHVSPALQVVRYLELVRFNKEGEFHLNLNKKHDFAFISKKSTMEDILYLRWGNTVDKQQKRAKPHQQFGGCPGSAEGILKHVTALTLQAFPQSSDGRNLTVRCPYHLTIDMADYHNNVKISSSPNATQYKRFGFSMLTELVENRFVLMGMSMDRLADTVDSPVHGKIAGVYAHAMGIDNLLEYGNGFFRAYQPEPDAVIQSEPWLILFQYSLTGALAFSFLLYGAEIRKKMIKGRWNGLWNWVGLVLSLVFMAVLLISMILRLAFEGSNWLDYVLVAVMAFGFAYTVFIFFGPWLMDWAAIKSANLWIEKFEEGIRERNSGLKEFLPLIALVYVVWFVLLGVGLSMGYFSHGDPFNFLFVFLSLCALLVLALNNELFGGLVTFLAGKSIAKEFY